MFAAAAACEACLGSGCVSCDHGCGSGCDKLTAHEILNVQEVHANTLKVSLGQQRNTPFQYCFCIHPPKAQDHKVGVVLMEECRHGRSDERATEELVYCYRVFDKSLPMNKQSTAVALPFVYDNPLLLLLKTRLRVELLLLKVLSRGLACYYCCTHPSDMLPAADVMW